MYTIDSISSSLYSNLIVVLFLSFFFFLSLPPRAAINTNRHAPAAHHCQPDPKIKVITPTPGDSLIGINTNCSLYICIAGFLGKKRGNNVVSCYNVLYNGSSRKILKRFKYVALQWLVQFLGLLIRTI